MGAEPSPAPDPKRAVNGFVMYLAAKLGLVVYLVWAIVPESWLAAVGLTYWPQKYWALAGPIVVCAFIVFCYALYFATSLVVAPPLSSLKSITDDKALRTADQKSPRGSIRPIGDVHISDVSRKLYLT